MITIYLALAVPTSIKSWDHLETAGPSMDQWGHNVIKKHQITQYTKYVSEKPLIWQFQLFGSA